MGQLCYSSNVTHCDAFYMSPLTNTSCLVYLIACTSRNNVEPNIVLSVVELKAIREPANTELRVMDVRIDLPGRIDTMLSAHTSHSFMSNMIVPGTCLSESSTTTALTH